MNWLSGETPSETDVGEPRAGESAEPTRRAARLGALGNVGADAHRHREAGNHPRLRRVSRRAVPGPLPGARRAGGRGARRRAAEARGHHRRRQRLPRPRSRRVGAAAVDVSRCRRAGGRDLAATRARDRAPRASSDARSLRSPRRDPHRRVGTHDAQSARLDGKPPTPGAVALCAGVRRLVARAPRGRRHRCADRLSRAGARGCARASDRGALAAAVRRMGRRKTKARASNACPPDSTAARSPTIPIASIGGGRAQ